MLIKSIMKKIVQISILFTFLFSCQPIEISEKIVFDNNILSKINIHAEQIIVNDLYEPNYSATYIDHSLENPPIIRIKNWINNNILVFGSENILHINILDSSIVRLEREKENKKKFSDKNEFYYEINYKVEFILYDDNERILATAKAVSNNSTTSDKYISLSEKEIIIDSLILDALIDISNKSDELIKKHMSKFVI